MTSARTQHPDPQFPSFPVTQHPRSETQDRDREQDQVNGNDNGMDHRTTHTLRHMCHSWQATKMSVVHMIFDGLERMISKKVRNLCYIFLSRMLAPAFGEVSGSCRLWPGSGMGMGISGYGYGLQSSSRSHDTRSVPSHYTATSFSSSGSCLFLFLPLWKCVY
uniref:HDC19511 n=1 Tax=Drosophila melanogaster TaxID=7227 RepID=Q6II81_DROME|nr:TPA_inf: HDC19511 [Drosophila melanogaster]